jgi:ferredoxin
MRGTSTDRDRRLAHLIHAYKQSFDKVRGPLEIKFPPNRVIPIGETIRPESKVHTSNQLSSYIDRADIISVATCFCRHEAKLLDEKDDCGMPDEVCMNFGMSAQFLIDRGMGRKVTRDEAKDILRKASEAGLVHAGLNIQELDFVCNCCACHCMILKSALSQPKPGRALYSGYQPCVDTELCTSCETCIGRCPAKAMTMIENLPSIDSDRCFGCGVCAVGCPMEAIKMEEKPGLPMPPVNRKELQKVMKSQA